MLLSPSQMLRERYRIIGLLGQGGMAAVYCAHDKTLDRLVAIKQLRPDPFASEKAIAQARQQFKHEAQILATLDHSNLPRVTDYFESDGIEYLVMDYVEGQTLSDLAVKHGGGLDEVQVLDWAEQLLGALDYIHRHGIIHRDVKPSNIRLTPDGRIFLVDFGLVKLFDASNPKTATMMHGLGTPEYAPPEQYDAHLGHTDPRSDVYALGATMYHLLTGYAPATATQRVSDPTSFQAPRVLGAHVSSDIERLILRAMELQRARRFESAAEMRSALQQAKRHIPTEDSLTRRLPTWSASQPDGVFRRVAPVGIIALIVVGGLIGLARGVESAASAPPPSATLTPTRIATRPPSATPSATARPSRTPALRTLGATGPDAGSNGLPIDELSATATLTPTVTLSSSPARSPTPTSSPTWTATSPPSRRTSTFTPSPTLTATPTPLPTNTPTNTPPRPTATVDATATPSEAAGAVMSPTPTSTPP